MSVAMNVAGMGAAHREPLAECGFTGPPMESRYIGRPPAAMRYAATGASASCIFVDVRCGDLCTIV